MDILCYNIKTFLNSKTNYISLMTSTYCLLTTAQLISASKFNRNTQDKDSPSLHTFYELWPHGVSGVKVIIAVSKAASWVAGGVLGGERATQWKWIELINNQKLSSHVTPNIVLKTNNEISLMWRQKSSRAITHMLAKSVRIFSWTLWEKSGISET